MKIAVSGKGGVGKSLVTSLMAVNMQRKGYRYPQRWPIYMPKKAEK